MEYVADVIRNYGSSVQHGHRHIYQSVPRLLTVWFEFGTHCVGITGKPSKQVAVDAAQRSPLPSGSVLLQYGRTQESLNTPPKSSHELCPSGAGQLHAAHHHALDDDDVVGMQERQAQTDVQAAMQKLSRELPQYAWLVALPQLTSRICHPHQPTQDMVQHILTRLTGSYPQQARPLLNWCTASSCSPMIRPGAKRVQLGRAVVSQQPQSRSSAWPSRWLSYMRQLEKGWQLMLAETCALLALSVHHAVPGLTPAVGCDAGSVGVGGRVEEPGDGAQHGGQHHPPVRQEG